MRDRVESRAPMRAVAGILLLAALLLFGAGSFAQAPASEDAAARQAQVAAILDRHSNLTDQARALGEATYKQVCAACHDNGVNRAPPASAIGYISPAAIVQILTDGPMKAQAAGLSAEQKTAVAEFLAGRMIGAATASPTKMCAAGRKAWFDPAQPPDLSGWGLDANNAHAIPTVLAGLDRTRIAKLRLKWSLAFPDVLYARSQPTLAGGAIFVGSDNGTVYALDPASGCAHWTYHAGGPIRSGVVVGGWKAGDAAVRPLVYFGDMLGRAYAVDARTGKLAWQRAMDKHPNATLTAAPALRDGVLYVAVSSLEEPAAGSPTHECCTFRGSLVALDAATGREKWRAWMVDQPVARGKSTAGTTLYGPSGVAIWSTPLIDDKRGLAIVATGDNYSAPATKLSDSIVAIDLKTGAVRWSYQATGSDMWNAACGYSAGGGNCPDDAGPDYDFGSAPIMARGADGHDYVLAGQKSGILYAVDPDSGVLKWKQRVGRGGVFGGIHFGIAAANGKVFVPMADMADGKEYDQPARPGVFALDVASGKEVWAAPAGDTCADRPFCQPGYGAAISVTPDFVLAGSMDGHVRIFDAANGKVLRDIDTAVPYVTVNGSDAKGGSMAGGSAPIAWHGKLIVTSGYGGLGKMPGNVMAVYAAD